MNTLLEFYFRNHLAANGYGGCDSLSWSLNCDQNDHVNFSGTISEPANIIARLASDKGRKAISFIFAGDKTDAHGSISLTRRHAGCSGSYCFVDIDTDQALDPQDHDSAHQKIMRELAGRHLDAFETFLKNDVRQTESELKRLGHSILESIDPFWWAEGEELSRFHQRATIILERNIGALNVRWLAKSLQDEDLHESEDLTHYQEAIAKGRKFATISCLVSRNGDEIAESYNLVGDFPAHDWMASPEMRDIIKQALEAVREDIRDQSRATPVAA